MTGDPGERDQIRAAMDRIMDGVPERSDGALTVVALATEPASRATRSPSGTRT